MPPLNGRRRGRQQPPIHSPISAPALGHALVSGLGGQDPRLTFAARLARDYAADHVVLTDSGTDALQLALGAAFHAIPGPQVVALPAYSCFDVATAAVGSGADVVCYDIDPGTLGPDLGSMRWCLRQGARVIVVAPLYGIPIDMAAVAQLAAEWSAVVIEDAAQGFGSTWRERPLGTSASLSVLSFGRGKGWTGGSGGAVLCRDPAPWNDRLTLIGGRSRTAEFLAFGAATAQWALGRPETYVLPSVLPGLHLGETRYHPPRVARPMRRFAAALLEQTAAAAEHEAAYRREVGRWYEEAVPWSTTLMPIRCAPGGRPGWLRYPVLRMGGWEGLRHPEEARALGLAPGYPRVLPALPEIAGRLPVGCEQEATPGAAETAERLITLPTHSLLTRPERSAVVRLLADQPGREWESSRS
jgi:dTDP-4-amino-4,6-dideoxygalactose transaminase